MHTEAVPDGSPHHEAAVAADSGTLTEDPTEASIQPVSRAPAEVQLRAPATTVTQTREAINLRVLLELRRRLKSAAEKELAVGADRMRALRGLLRRAESELRLCAHSLETRAQQLAQTASRVEKAQAQAAHTCARLSSLEHEHADLSQQLSAAQSDTAGIQLSMGSALGESGGTREAGAARPNHAGQVDAERPSFAQAASFARQASFALARSGTLDSFVLAAAALMSDLSHAISDQASLRARGRDLIETGESCAARARTLQTCFQAAHRAMMAMRDKIRAELDGSRG
jgi:chromosome segregation ATPase